MKEPFFVVGPTGVGKSRFAVAMAQECDGEIVCADAFQIYRGLDILTAQPNAQERENVPHHLYGSLEPSEGCTAARFADMATNAIASIQARGKLAIVVGGSGFYIHALCGGLDSIPDTPPELRAEVSALSIEEALARLDILDPAARESIDTKNPRRVARALEIVLLTGCPLATSRRGASKRIEANGIFLSRVKNELDAHIAANVERSFASGAIEEVATVSQSAGRNCPAAQAIGFREILDYLDGKISREEAIALTVRASCRYAKRQVTWFRNKIQL